ncbi:MAG: GNAT family N-acetyltransferase [Verrucomicrobiales bacterium]|nr:GNAT family N-acetyltransferase [Verrucomicrobiales bacterium]
MKLLFSEYDPDYSRYLYPYVVWATPEPHETPADLYDAGFHPASPDLDRFTLCRQLRVRLSEFRPSSENRRILRKAAGLRVEVCARADYVYTSERRSAWLAFAEERFGAGIMPGERLDALMHGRVITHLLRCVETRAGGEEVEVGAVLMYLEPLRMAHYYYAFYDRAHPNRSLGLAIMTLAVRHFQGAGYTHLYLGTCYSERALYKTQFHAMEFSQGTGWSSRVDGLRGLIRRDARRRHLLQEPEFLEAEGGWEALKEGTIYRMQSGCGPG